MAVLDVDAVADALRTMTSLDAQRLRARFSTDEWLELGELLGVEMDAGVWDFDEDFEDA
ncbi:MAG: hypothetical protein AAGB07_15600 [Pseudomonadota bacterium]